MAADWTLPLLLATSNPPMRPLPVTAPRILTTSPVVSAGGQLDRIYSISGSRRPVSGLINARACVTFTEANYLSIDSDKLR